MYLVYILKSKKDGKNYIEYTSNVERRLAWHNSGKNISTKYRTPFEIIFQKKFESKPQAMKYEKWLKQQKGGIKIKELLHKPR